MKHINIPLRKSFKVKVTAILILSMLMAGALSNFLVYRYALNSQFNALRNRLMIIAQMASLMIDPDTLTQVPLNRDGMDTPAFKEIAQRLAKIKEVNPPIRYIYILSKSGEKGTWQFVVDPEPTAKSIGKPQTTSYPGDRYAASRFPEMIKAFNSPAADTKLEIDEWGVTLSGYAPIRDKDKKTVAVLGVDMQADDVYIAQRATRLRAVFVMAVAIVLSLFFGALIAGWITDPVEKLVEGTRHIADGNFQHQVNVRGADEISELARSFNQMAKSLRESREKLVNYLYNVAQAFVRILEARDPYTRGHSERVAEHAKKIALKMGFPKEKIDLLENAALLHDIGKIRIDEGVLSKKGELTDEEWEMIRRHPIDGEDMVKPVAFDDETLTIIRSHHERYDGSGYPDKIGGENIDMLAAIVSVADAYDAMTSPRTYRAARTKEDAIEELKRNKGSQLNPAVVDAFIEILRSS